MPHDDALRRVRVHSVDTPYPLQATLDSARRWAEARIDRID